MLLPFDTVLRRGVILLWKQYGELDDPAFAGQTKAKFLVILSATPDDDPIVYILTTSSKPKHILHPAPDDLLRIEANAYDCFDAETILDAGNAGQREVDLEQLKALYERQDVVYRGCLTDADCAALMERIARSPRASRRIKQILGLNEAQS